jgi:hypothetical protein
MQLNEVFSTIEEGPKPQIEQLRNILAGRQAGPVKFSDGTMRVDMYSASAVVQVYDAVGDETKQKLDTMLASKLGFMKIADFAFKRANAPQTEGKSENRKLWDKIKSKGVVPGIDRERYTDMSGEGLEGPFRMKNGQVLYYDPKEGKYYNRDTDMYVDYEDYRAMNEKQLAELGGDQHYGDATGAWDKGSKATPITPKKATKYALKKLNTAFKKTKKPEQGVSESLEALARHVKEGVPLCDSLFRYMSEGYFEVFNHARKLREAGSLPQLDWESEEMLASDIGQKVKLKGLGEVYLDVPYMDESADEGTISQMSDAELADYINVSVEKVKADRDAAEEIANELTRDHAEESVNEAEYAGKDVDLNKPKRGGSKKYYVYVKNPKTDRVKKIEFGDVTGLRTKSNNPDRARSFAARHNCEKKNDKTKAGYWACRLPRYGLVKGGKWW